MKRAESRLTESMDEESDLGLAPGHAPDRTFEIVASNEEFAHCCEAVRQLPIQRRRAFVLKKVSWFQAKSKIILAFVSEAKCLLSGKG